MVREGRVTALPIVTQKGHTYLWILDPLYHPPKPPALSTYTVHIMQLDSLQFTHVPDIFRLCLQCAAS